MNTTDSTIAGAQPVWKGGKMWRPVRGVAPVSTSNDQIQKLQKQIQGLKTTVADATAPAVSPDAPGQVTGVSASVTPKNVSGVLKSLVAISFTAGTNFAAAQIWFTGYSGSENPQLMAQGSASPVAFYAETTGETVTVTVVAVNSAGVAATFAGAPTTTLTLSPTGTAPPAPTINSALAALAGSAGWQFSWNVLAGLLTDVISGYWVYRSASGVTPVPPANRVQFFAQPSSNLGTLTYQDYISGTYYYWVSAVSVTGLESTLTPATSTSLSSRVYPSTQSGSYTDPTNAYDGNETSNSYAFMMPSGSVGTTLAATETWSGFPNITASVINGYSLDVLAYARVTGEGNAGLNYSLDGGSSWSPMISISTSAGGTASQAQQYFSATMPTTQDLTLVQVQATNAATMYADGGGHVIPGTSILNIYEIHITTDYTP